MESRFYLTISSRHDGSHHRLDEAVTPLHRVHRYFTSTIFRVSTALATPRSCYTPTPPLLLNPGSGESGGLLANSF